MVGAGMLEESYAKLSELRLLPSSSPPIGEILADPRWADQDEWLLPVSLWLHAGIAVQLHYRKGEVPDYASHLARIAALDGNPYGIRDVEVLPPQPHLLEQEHGFLRGPQCYLTYRSDPGGEHHALVSALHVKGEGSFLGGSLGRALPDEPLADGRRLWMIGPAKSPAEGERVAVVVLARGDAVAAYERWAGARRRARAQRSTAWRVREPRGSLRSDPAGAQVAKRLRDLGAHPVLAQAVAAPESLRWDGNAQLDGLVAADRIRSERGLWATWESARELGPETPDRAERMRSRAATAAVLLAEVFGHEGPLHEAATWPPDSEAWGRLHPASALAPASTLKGHYERRRRVLGPRILQTLRAGLDDTADARGEEYRITPFTTIEWAAQLGLDDRVEGRSTVYQPLVRRHLDDGSPRFVDAVLAAARAGTPDAGWLSTGPRIPAASVSVDPSTGTDALWEALVASGLLPDAVAAQGADFARSIPYLEEDQPEQFAVQVLEKAGIGREIGEGEIEPPYPDLLRAFAQVSAGRVEIENVSQEYVAAELLALRWTQDGDPREREVQAPGMHLITDDASDLLPRVSDPDTGEELQLWEIEEAVVVLWARPGAPERYRKAIRGRWPEP